MKDSHVLDTFEFQPFFDAMNESFGGKNSTLPEPSGTRDNRERGRICRLPWTIFMAYR
jgi:hypothetical protein